MGAALHGPSAGLLSPVHLPRRFQEDLRRSCKVVNSLQELSCLDFLHIPRFASHFYILVQDSSSEAGMVVAPSTLPEVQKLQMDSGGPAF